MHQRNARIQGRDEHYPQHFWMLSKALMDIHKQSGNRCFSRLPLKIQANAIPLFPTHPPFSSHLCMICN
jgi:hypothetical protein